MSDIDEPTVSPEPQAPPKSAWPYALAAVLAMAVSVALAIPHAATLYGVGSEAQRAGFVAGSVLMPLLVAGLVAIAPSFRTLRRFSTVTLVVAGLSIMSHLQPLAAVGRQRAAERRQDDERIAAMQQEVADLQRQMLETDDLAASAALQARARQAFEAVLPRLSPRGRAQFGPVVKVLQPLLTDSQVYAGEAAAFFTSPMAKYATCASRADIDARIAAVGVLQQRNLALRQRCETLTADAERQIAQEELTAVERQGILDGFREGLQGKAHELLQVRDVDAQIYEQYVLALRHLQANFGKWHGKADEVVFDGEAERVAFQAFLDRIDDLGEQQAAIQRRLLPKLR